MANITVKYFSGCMALREALATMFRNIFRNGIILR